MAPLKLRTQVRLVALACLMLGIVGTFWVAAYYEGRLYATALERRAHVMVDALLASSIEPLLNYDVVQLDNLVEAIRREKSDTYQDLEYAEILDAEGRVLAHSHGYYLYGQVMDDPASLKARQSTADALVQRLDGNRVLDLSRPVIVGGKRWGTVRVGLNLALFQSQVSSTWWRTLFIVIAMALVLTAIASAALRPLFSGPLNEVIQATTAIGQQKFEYRIVHQRRDELGTLYDAINRMAILLQDRQKLHATFGQYVNSSVRDALLAGQVPAAGTRVRAAFLFADLRGFTRRCESLPPEQVLSLLNRFFSKMTWAIETHGGIVDKFIGDSVMAVFGAPLPSPDCALDAVRSACAMRDGLAELNVELLKSGQDALRMGIGIHVGECVAGSVGAPTRMQYTVMGDAVNVAARLEELTKECAADVLLSGDVLRACGDRLDVREIGERELRGRNTRARVYALLAVRAQDLIRAV